MNLLDRRVAGRPQHFILLLCGVVLGFMAIFFAIPKAKASSASYTVSSHAMPWEWTNGGLNSAFHFGINDGEAPVVIDVSAAQGQSVIIHYLSGTISAAPVGSIYPFVDANGDTAFPENDQNGSSGQPLPSFYMKPYPINLTELVGTFADSTGAIVGTPFAIGDGPTPETVPEDATQLQIGVNDDIFSDNVGSWTIEVSVPSCGAPPVCPAPGDLPGTINETEGPYSGVWTLNSSGGFNGTWNNGAIATITVSSFTFGSVTLNRTDTSASVSSGLTAVYTGQVSSAGDSIVNGSVTFTWPGVTGYPSTGTWTASWSPQSCTAPRSGARSNAARSAAVSADDTGQQCTIDDTVQLTGGIGSSALWVNGLVKGQQWDHHAILPTTTNPIDVGANVTLSTYTNLPEFVANQIIAFNETAPPEIIPAVWSDGTDNIVASFRPPPEVNVKIWIIADPAAKMKAENDFQYAMGRAKSERVGFSLVDTVTVLDSSTLNNFASFSQFVCTTSNIATARLSLPFMAGVVNIYYFPEVEQEKKHAGKITFTSINGCTDEPSHNFIAISVKAPQESLIHELGHAMSLKHPCAQDSAGNCTAILNGFSGENIMTQQTSAMRQYFTEGQTFRMNFNENSALFTTYNVFGAGRLTCDPLQADLKCPAADRRLWPDGALGPN